MKIVVKMMVIQKTKNTKVAVNATIRIVVVLLLAIHLFL
ncbi:hypothetical protein FEM08_02950 [Flavobacterium gilvum]|nr:hypothetical protein FEM08_02950 [Flavobacterium gilvum]